MSRWSPTGPSKAEAARREAREQAEEAWRNRMRKLSSCSCLDPVPGRRYLGLRACARCGLTINTAPSSLAI